MPASSQHFEGEDYLDVVATLEDAGYTKVEAKGLEDLITGWLKKEGAVDEVKVDGETNFSSGALYPKDVPIVVSYHSFPPGSEPTPSTPESVPSASATESSLAERTRAKFLSARGVETELDLLNLDGNDLNIPTYAIVKWEDVSGGYVRVYVQEEVSEETAQLLGKQILGLTCVNSQGTNGADAVPLDGIVVQGVDGLDINVYKSVMPLCTM